MSANKTTVLACSCDHKEQDRLHSRNFRVHNMTRNTDENKASYRCTVCGTVRTVNK